MVQRIFEMAVGICASAFGLLLLYSLFFAPTMGGPNGSYSAVSQYHDLSWLPAFLAFAAALAAIGLSALTHSAFSFVRTNRHARTAFMWAGGVALWCSTAGLIVLIYLAGFSIGLVFIPSAVLALIACVLALIPGPQPQHGAIA